MNYYEILEVSPKASKEVMRAAYKSLMQRYHPDKNHENPQAATHAALIVQAYEVLSDVERRNIYDLQLKDQSERKPFVPPQNHTVAQPLRRTSINRQIAEKNAYSWYPWLLISVIVLSGWLILSLSKKKQSDPLQDLRAGIDVGQLAEKQTPAGFGQPGPSRTRTGKRATELDARTIQVFSTTMVVRLKMPDKFSEDEEKPPGQSEHVLSIPVLFVRVGSFDSEKFIYSIDSRKESLILQLADRLAYANHEELSKVDGEQYLKKMILDAIGKITGTDRFEEYPSSEVESPGRYGVTEVFLPESFSLNQQNHPQ